MDSAISLAALGGPVVWVLIALSLMSATIVIAKLMQFAGTGLLAATRADEALALVRAGRVDEARSVLAGRRHPIAQCLFAIVEGARAGRDVAFLREEAYALAAERLDGLRSWFRPLEVIAALAPLLGLFGTVLGMIAAFQDLEAAGHAVNPSVLSGGIWEALLTTAVGLAVAIPTVAFLNLLDRWTERVAHRLEATIPRALAAIAERAADRSEGQERHARLHAV